MPPLWRKVGIRNVHTLYIFINYILLCPSRTISQSIIEEGLSHMFQFWYTDRHADDPHSSASQWVKVEALLDFIAAGEIRFQEHIFFSYIILNMSCYGVCGIFIGKSWLGWSMGRWTPVMWSHTSYSKGIKRLWESESFTARSGCLSISPFNGKMFFFFIKWPPLICIQKVGENLTSKEDFRYVLQQINDFYIVLFFRNVLL